MGFLDIPEGSCKSSVVESRGMGSMCSMAKKLLNGAVYEPLIQATVAPAGYFRDTDNITNYRNKSSFLAKLNNEVKPASEHSQK